MRSFAFASLLLSTLFSLSLAYSDDLPPHSIEPTRSSQLFRRGGSGTSDDSPASSLESSVMALASSASKAVKGQGVCSSNSTCAGFIHFAQICSEKEDSAAIAGCICSAASLEVMNACTDCISSNNVKANANRFSSFCNQASSTLAALAATQTSSTIFPSSTSNSNNDNHSGASALYAPIGVTGMVIGVLGVFSLVM